jgi:hypothetical protein
MEFYEGLDADFFVFQDEAYDGHQIAPLVGGKFLAEGCRGGSKEFDTLEEAHWHLVRDLAAEPFDHV